MNRQNIENKSDESSEESNTENDDCDFLIRKDADLGDKITIPYSRERLKPRELNSLDVSKIDSESESDGEYEEIDTDEFGVDYDFELDKSFGELEDSLTITDTLDPKWDEKWNKKYVF